MLKLDIFLCWIVCAGWFVSCFKDQPSTIVFKHTLLLTHPENLLQTINGFTTRWIQRMQWIECFFTVHFPTACVCVFVVCMCGYVGCMCVCRVHARVFCGDVSKLKGEQKIYHVFMWCYGFRYEAKHVIWYMYGVRVVLVWSCMWLYTIQHCIHICESVMQFVRTCSFIFPKFLTVG
jgi:hypothetical protein